MSRPGEITPQPHLADASPHSDRLSSQFDRPYGARRSNGPAFPGFRPPRRTSSWAIFDGSLWELIIAGTMFFPGFLEVFGDLEWPFEEGAYHRLIAGMGNSPGKTFAQSLPCNRRHRAESILL